ncbi:hypothetical protein [Delftia sp. PS-11]|uniref:hypothetical protein n=1 Tax=Delftia sp. PS-11 TaxID=2767222 RepID=UPI0024540FE3|nr:hypothetical protein [Delftia sp. PS-11]KAJ8746059.1 hypothetical protein H9T68_02815 [Delftia sp. PS-11]
MTPTSSPNLDKLRNIVQKFGAHSFTTGQVASEYDDEPANAEAAAQFDALLQRHAAVLGIQAVSAAQGSSATVWQLA